mmetsp:Transcript_92125/g.298266  ORF Transcript_92125/g.298266 Transcript_92125/m.298266 type:complete len:320 (-) Transcript_92125:53-1012(-)
MPSPPHPHEPGNAMLLPAALLLALLGLTAAADPSCWGGGVTEAGCCDRSQGPRGNEECWDADYTFERCCDTTPVPPLSGAAQGYPDCLVQGVVLRHSGEHGLFVDVTIYGDNGCFQRNCSYSDKFHAEDPSLCARSCAETEECTHWTFGEQEGGPSCFLRRSDDGRERVRGWSAGEQACAPPQLPDAFAAMAIADSPSLRACDSGKGEGCPDVAAAINTWLLAIRHLKRAVEGRVDEQTMGHVRGISEDSAAFRAQLDGSYRPSDADFPRMVYNNRMVFDALHSWLDAQPKAELKAADASLPKPLRTGELCGKVSCYGP